MGYNFFKICPISPKFLLQMKSSNIMKLITALYFNCSHFMTLTMIIYHNCHKILEWLHKQSQKCNDVQKMNYYPPKKWSQDEHVLNKQQHIELDHLHQPLASPSHQQDTTQCHNTFRAAPFISSGMFNEIQRLKNYYAVQFNDNLFDICNLKNIPHKMLGLNMQKSAQSEFSLIFIHSKC
jgi:hypothetical protein